MLLVHSYSVVQFLRLSKDSENHKGEERNAPRQIVIRCLANLSDLLPPWPDRIWMNGKDSILDEANKTDGCKMNFVDMTHLLGKEWENTHSQESLLFNVLNSFSFKHNHVTVLHVNLAQCQHWRASGCISPQHRSRLHVDSLSLRNPPESRPLQQQWPIKLISTSPVAIIIWQRSTDRRVALTTRFLVGSEVSA